MTVLDIVLMVALVASALATVALPRVILAVISLASTSAVLTIIMFRLDSPLAAVFELSVCAGLIPAIFISVIGLVRRMGPEAMAARAREKLRRFWLLPVLVIVAGVVLWQVSIPVVLPGGAQAASAPAQADVRTVMWHERHADLLGQVVVLLGGAFGVVVLLKSRDAKAPADDSSNQLQKDAK